MVDTSVQVAAVLGTLDEIEAYVRAQPSSLVPDRQPILAAILAWKVDAVDAPGRLRPLLDLDTIPSLVAVRHWHGQGVGFFLPIIIAWFILGIAEFQYQSAKTPDSFFVWWSSQTFGPATYSFAIAVLLIAIVGFRIYRDSGANKADQVEATLSKFAGTACVQAARLVDNEKPLEQAANALTMAADRLSSVGRSLSAMPANVKDALLAAQTASMAIVKLDEVTSKFSAQVESLTESLSGASGVVASWDEKLAPIRETLDGLTKLSATSQAQSSKLTEQLAGLVGILPSAVDIANTSGETAQETSRALPDLVSATSTLASAVTALGVGQAKTQELIVSAQRIVAFLDDRIDGKFADHEWPPVPTTSSSAE